MPWKAAADVPAAGTSEGSTAVFDPSGSSGGLAETADEALAAVVAAAAAAVAGAVADHNTAAGDRAATGDETRWADCWLGEKRRRADWANKGIHRGLEALGSLAAGAAEPGSSLVFVHYFSKRDGSRSGVAGWTVDGGKGRRSPVETRTARV